MSEKIRLLFCGTCGTVDELPFYDGPAEYDTTLEYLISSRHTTESGQTHIAALPLGIIAKSEWENPTYRKAILDEANKVMAAGGSDGLGTKFYDTRNTFSADAHSCWKYHGRTKNCGDYRSDRKKLIPDTKELRKEAGLSTRPVSNTFLCDFCPYHSIVMQRQRAAAGTYDYTN
ncbi:hypothetical protein FDA94_28975 [Herbidospora galbida]|uniref:Uncharacterized protein n=1 Tax=Herbidospora galbida TaxID=2575442 RepID=A0A4U3M764_9ACTN|nr:hypothetical protein [Herbidospora galbida]TKK84651.1 hypothetical protein FDA94_28975 [Herbidospora galbida]